ncbi:hypothetical protein [Halovenus sp. HT40]|uniref:hypothetical protein n=1 Tax=Halovenus sp. HT40 TaxID=3126691 RepID=UPI00300EAC33
MTNRENQSKFIRRKFTITERLDEILVETAEQHYQGNVSLCIRAAIEDHRSSLDGTGDAIAVQQLAREIDKIRSQLEDIKTSGDKSESSQSSRSEDAESEMSRIVNLIKQSEQGLRLSDIDDQLDIPISKIQSGLGRLVDQGRLMIGPDSTERFYLVGQQSKSKEKSSRFSHYE